MKIKTPLDMASETLDRRVWEYIERIVSLDDDDPESPGRRWRQTVTLQQITDMAQELQERHFLIEAVRRNGCHHCFALRQFVEGGHNKWCPFYVGTHQIKIDLPSYAPSKALVTEMFGAQYHRAVVNDPKALLTVTDVT